MTQAVMAGLLARERTGRGQKIDVPMLGALLPALTTRLASFWAEGIDSQRFGAAHSAVTPYELYHASDGDIVAGTWSPEAWPKFCEAVGMPELADKPEFRTNLDRLAHRAELKLILDRVFATHSVADWERRFHDASALFGRVNTMSQAISQPQVDVLGQIRVVLHPTAGEIRQVGPAVLMSDTPPDIRMPPPLLGQHTEEVLLESGYTPAAVRKLIADGVAQAADTAAPPAALSEGVG
jgi:crotonobetainyl-CoA:carnitine CoA-transferase CaiB-like acyl-CoA transferase